MTNQAPVVLSMASPLGLHPVSTQMSHVYHMPHHINFYSPSHVIFVNQVSHGPHDSLHNHFGWSSITCDLCEIVSWSASKGLPCPWHHSHSQPRIYAAGNKYFNHFLNLCWIHTVLVCSSVFFWIWVDSFFRFPLLVMRLSSMPVASP